EAVDEAGALQVLRAVWHEQIGAAFLVGNSTGSERMQLFDGHRGERVAPALWPVHPRGRRWARGLVGGHRCRREIGIGGPKGTRAREEVSRLLAPARGAEQADGLLGDLDIVRELAGELERDGELALAGRAQAGEDQTEQTEGV